MIDFFPNSILSFKFKVKVTVNVENLDEYIDWLQGGHVQEVFVIKCFKPTFFFAMNHYSHINNKVCERGATGAEILVIDNSENPEEPIVGNDWNTKLLYQKSKDFY